MGVTHPLGATNPEIGPGKEAGQHTNTLHGRSTKSVWEAKTNKILGKILNISQEKQIQAYWRDKTVLLLELGGQELKPQGDSTNSVFYTLFQYSSSVYLVWSVCL